MNLPKLKYYPVGDGVVAFSTTRHGGASQGNYAAFNINPYCGDQPSAILQNRQALSSVFGLEVGCIVLPHQTHGTEIRVIGDDFPTLSETEKEQRLDGVDAVVTQRSGLCIGVSTADCIPVLIYDCSRRVVAAIHAGWRGTVARIVEKTIATMQQTYNCKAEHMSAVIGPGISQRCFEVGDEVYDAFSQAGFDMDGIAIRHGKWHIDLPECNRQQLLRIGMKASHILMSGICTYEQSADYFSARRLGIHSGRIYTGIYIIDD